jgi:hypothetical protein
MKKKTLIKLFLFIIALIAIGFCSKNLIKSFNCIFQTPWLKNHPYLLFIHFLFLTLVFVIFAKGWTIVLKTIGRPFPAVLGAYSWLMSNAGKYVPGKVFMFAGRLSLCTRIGIRQSVCFWAFALEHFFMLFATLPFLVPVFLQGKMPTTIFIYSICSMVLIATLLIGKPGLFFTFINKLLMGMHREPLNAVPSSTSMLLLLGTYLLAWTLYGISGVILSNVLEIQSTLSEIEIASIFVISWLVGFLSILTPGGIGVREATLVLLLQPNTPATQAIALSLLARATWTIVEIAGAGFGFWIGKRLFKNEENAY